MDEKFAFELARDVCNATMNELTEQTQRIFPEKQRAKTFFKTLKKWFNIEQIWTGLNARERQLFFEFLSPEDLAFLVEKGHTFEFLNDN